jgi:urease accessory protein UreF
MIDARFLQLCDSAFPSGAFSQSFGLETAIVERGIADATGVRAWIVAYLERNLATLDARAIVLGLRGAANLEELDALLAVSVFAHDIRTANRRLARATLEAYSAMGIIDDGITAYREAVLSGAASGQHALACMLMTRTTGRRARARLRARSMRCATPRSTPGCSRHERGSHRHRRPGRRRQNGDGRTARARALSAREPRRRDQRHLHA